MGAIGIQSECDAWRLLRQLTAETSDGDVVDVLFDRWPKIQVVVKPGDGKPTLEIFETLKSVQTALFHIYAIAKYGVANTSVLTKREREELRLDFEIRPGSTEIVVNLWKHLNKIGSVFGDKHKNKAPACMIAVALIFGASDVGVSYLEHASVQYEQDTKLKIAAANAELEVKKEALRTEQQLEFVLSTQKMAEKHAEQMRLLAEVVVADRTDVSRYAASDANPWRAKVLALAPKSGSVVWNGVEIPHKPAKALSEKISRRARLQKANREDLSNVTAPWITKVIKSRELGPPMRVGLADLA